MSLLQLPIRNANRPVVTDGMSLGEMAQRWACRPHRWWHLVQHRPNERWFTRLFTSDDAEGWLITWAPGTSLDLHDHGDVPGALAVVSGNLVERFRDRRFAEPFATRALVEGSIVTFGPDHAHEVINAGEKPAISIHVYSPRLEEMTFYAGDVAAVRSFDPEDRIEAIDDPLADLAANLWVGGL